MGRKESVSIVRHIPESMLYLTITVYESMRGMSKSDECVLKRLRFVMCRYRGDSVAEAARKSEVSRKTGYNIQDAWNDGGLDGIIPRFSAGPEPRLSMDDMEDIERFLAENPMDASNLRRHIREIYGEDFTEKHIRNMFMGRGLKYSRELRRTSA